MRDEFVRFGKRDTPYVDVRWGEKQTQPLNPYTVKFITFKPIVRRRADANSGQLPAGSPVSNRR